MTFVVLTNSFVLCLKI